MVYLSTSIANAKILHEKDALRALAGLTRRFSKSLNYPIFYSLLIGVFDTALLFKNLIGDGRLRWRISFLSSVIMG